MCNRANAIYDLGRFRDLSRNQVNSFVDLMSGVKCLVAVKVKERAVADGVPLDVYCFDIAFETMDPEKKRTLENEGYRLSSGDITEGVPFDDGKFDSAAARFGVKNYQPETQKRILREARRILVLGRYFGLIDMTAPETSYEWAQTERRRKSRHTVGEENAHHHVPTLDMWFGMLEESGFVPNRTDVWTSKSYVTTSDWVKGKQMSEDGMRDMNEFLLSAPEQVRRDYNIREEETEAGKVVKIDYPVVVIGARAI